MKVFLKNSILLLFLVSNGYAQTANNTECINNLSAANTLYEKAEFTEAIALLEPCIESGKFKKNEADAFRILALCYHQLNNESKTNNAIANLLKANIKYQQFPFNDPKDFTKIVNTFTVETKLNLGVKAGFNYSHPILSKGYSVKPSTIEMQSERGQFLGISGDYFLKGKTFGINFWTTASSMAFTQNVRFNDVERINFKEELKHTDFGLEIKYFILKSKKIVPYIGLGANLLLLRSAISNIAYSNSHLNIKSEISRDMKTEGSLNSKIYNGIADIGMNTNAGKGIFGLGLQYAYAFTLSNNSSKRYDNLDFTVSNQWIDSDIKMNYFNIYASYSFPLLWRIYK